MLTFAFMSCSNNEELAGVKPQTTTVATDILTFKTQAEFDSTVQKVNAMSDLERKSWEKSKGFTSFESICDLKYQSVNFDTLDTEELKSLINTQSKYIKLIEENGSTYCVTSEFDNNESCLLNADKMYIIGTDVYKTFDKCMISSNVKNIKRMKEIKDPTNLLSNNKEFGITSMKVPVKNAKQYQAIDLTHSVSNRRLKLWVQAELFHHYGFSPYTERQTEFTITNFAKNWTGVWYYKSMNTVYDVSITSHDVYSNIYNYCKGAGNHTLWKQNFSYKEWMNAGVTWDYPPYISGMSYNISNGTCSLRN